MSESTSTPPKSMPPPYVAPKNDDGPSESPSDERTGREWWQRQFLTFPVSVWLIAASVFVVVYLILYTIQNGGGAGSSDGAASSSADASASSSAGDASSAQAEIGGEGSELGAPARGELPPTSVIPPQPGISGCTSITDEITATINAGLPSGHWVGVAYTATDPAGRTLVGGSIFDGASGERLSENNLWIIEGTTSYSVNESARNNSSFPSSTELPESPTEQDAAFVSLLEDCAQPALLLSS